MQKKFLVVSLLLLIALFSSGCVNFNVITRVAEDGSGTWEMGFSLNDSFMTMFADMGMEDMGLEDMEDIDLSEGLLPGDATFYEDEETGIIFRIEERTVNDVSTVFIVAEIPNAESWALLEEAYTRVSEQNEEDNAEADDLGFEDDFGMGLTSPDDLTSELSLIPTVTFEGGRVRVSFAGISPAAALGLEETDASNPMMMFFNPAELFGLTYEIEIAGGVSDHNGTVDPETGNIVWVIDFTDTNDLDIYAEGGLR